VEVGLAVNRRWRGQDGQQREETCFIDCRAYGKQAETINQYMQKGRPLLIEGRLQLDSWEGKDGTRRSKHRVIIENFQFLGGAPGGQASQRGGPGQVADRQPAPQESSEQPPEMPPPDGDEIPF